MSGAIWFRRPTPTSIRERHVGTLPALMGMEFDEVGDDFIRGRIPVDERSIQPAGILHGGASVVLAETLGSTGCAYTLDPATHYCVGLEINANHVRAVTKGSGWVSGTARPVHRGRSTQVWEIRITDAQERLVCMSRLTLAILTKAAP
ncbi:MAG: hotdog fold thioesterase [Burkholderiales bacterium]|nr:hotdog fold thioesterase [Burkholderiales bacterium]